MYWCTHTDRIYKHVSTILTNAAVTMEGRERRGEKTLALYKVLISFGQGGDPRPGHF